MNPHMALDLYGTSLQKAIFTPSSYRKTIPQDTIRPCPVGYQAGYSLPSPCCGLSQKRCGLSSGNPMWQYEITLTGWWFYPSWKILVNGRMTTHILWKIKKFPLSAPLPNWVSQKRPSGAALNSSHGIKRSTCSRSRFVQMTTQNSFNSFKFMLGHVKPNRPLEAQHPLAKRSHRAAAVPHFGIL